MKVIEQYKKYKQEICRLYGKKLSMSEMKVYDTELY